MRSIDEGALDEKSGMNFSEYVAILSGDTSLLEKSKLDKQIAVLESLRSIHYKEIARTRLKLEGLESEKATVNMTLSQLTRDDGLYHSLLQTGKDGVKVNPLQLNSVYRADAERIGVEVLQLYKHWEPGPDKEQLIGTK